MRIRIVLPYLLPALVLGLETPCALAAGPVSGRNAAAVCTACHGAKGFSANEEWPNIAGQQAGYLAKQLADFRDGRRDSAIMSRVARHLSDSEIEALAGYFSALDRDPASPQPR